jgi:SAM-dependent methyltransferase
MKKYFDHISKFKKESEYYIGVGNVVLSTHQINNLKVFRGRRYVKKIDYDSESCKWVLSKKTINRFHPNNINNKKFWYYCKTYFPLFSVCGVESNNIDDCNKKNTNNSTVKKLLKFVDGYKPNNKINFFEIGYGHGNIFNYFKTNDRINYFGIDYYKIPELNEFKQLKTIKKSGIPNYVKNNSCDIIYSVNVLQHCSQKDRNDYFKQSYNKLKSGGVFIGTMFIESESVFHKFGIIDTNGRKYCKFFHQYIEIDTEIEFFQMVKEIGYSIEEYQMETTDSCYFILKK